MSRGVVKSSDHYTDASGGIARRDCQPSMLQEEIDTLAAFSEAILDIYWNRKYTKLRSEQELAESRQVLGDVIHKLVADVDYWQGSGPDLTTSKVSTQMLGPETAFYYDAAVRSEPIGPGSYSLADKGNLNDLAQRCIDDRLRDDDFVKLDHLAKSLGQRVTSQLDEPLLSATRYLD